MKNYINKILLLSMTVVFIAGTMGVNVFNHFCSHCYISHYSFDITPVNESSCKSSIDCACHCNCDSHEYMVNLDDVHHKHANDNDEDCSMHSHDHMFFHIDDSYSTPERLTLSTFFEIKCLSNCIGLLYTEECVVVNRTLYVDKCDIPDIIRLNCCFLC